MAVLPFAWFRFAFLATALRKVQFLILLGVTRKMPNIVTVMRLRLLVSGEAAEVPRGMQGPRAENVSACLSNFSG